MGLKAIEAVIAAYLLGSIPFGYLVYRLHRGGDVRATGSGNIGATNVLRGAGIFPALATLVLDAGKGYAAVALAGRLTGKTPEWISLAAVIAIAGHIFPVFLKFRGGKGVATGLGAFLRLAPVPVFFAVGLFLIVAAVWQYISLASIAAVAAFPFVLLAWDRASHFFLAAGAISAILIIWRHSSNIRRLLAGQETPVSARREVPDRTRRQRS